MVLLLVHWVRHETHGRRRITYSYVCIWKKIDPHICMYVHTCFPTTDIRGRIDIKKDFIHEDFWKQSWLLLSRHPAEVLLNPHTPAWHNKSPWPEIQSRLCVNGEAP